MFVNGLVQDSVHSEPLYIAAVNIITTVIWMDGWQAKLAYTVAESEGTHGQNE